MQLLFNFATLLALLLCSNSTFAKLQPTKTTNGCGECHVCTTPTLDDPCLRNCPRPRVSAQELKIGPDKISINEIESEYGPVQFSHRLHAEMTAMDRGCQDCHHFQEVGGITACKNCHPANAADENLEQPSLKGAYHRQCLGCHQDWSHDTSCEICHVKKGDEVVSPHPDMKSPGSRFKDLVEPEKKVWHSTYGGGTVVTLFHRNHTDIYGIDCAACHHAEGCASCHAKSEQQTQIRHSEEALHGICNACHAEMSCDQCHLKQEANSFSHNRTGWPLKSYHNQLACSRCHGKPDHFTKPSAGCNTCHKSWDEKSFQHERTGFALDETHKEASCGECHVELNFAVTPSCASCHDTDKTFPAFLPGTKLK